MVSSFARDIIGGEVREGGPARFITELLMRYERPYRLVTGETIRVEIDPVCEESIVRSEARIPSVPLQTPVLISTILREFDLTSLTVPFAIDIQGYVRNGRRLGGKQRWSEPALERAWLIKGTRREFSFVDQRFLSRNTTLLITDGERGFEVKGTEPVRMPARPIDAPDTIGAGDTLFARFALALIEGYGARDAARLAQADVESFLSAKVMT